MSLEPYELEFNNHLKERIRVIYNKVCQNCDCSEGKIKLHIHHIDYNKKNNKLDNLLPLCMDCHLRTNGSRKHWIKKFTERRLNANPELQLGKSAGTWKEMEQTDRWSCPDAWVSAIHPTLEVLNENF